MAITDTSRDCIEKALSSLPLADLRYVIPTNKKQTNKHVQWHPLNCRIERQHLRIIMVMECYLKIVKHYLEN